MSIKSNYYFSNVTAASSMNSIYYFNSNATDYESSMASLDSFHINNNNFNNNNGNNTNNNISRTQSMESLIQITRL